METAEHYKPPTRWSDRASQQENEPEQGEAIFFTLVRQQGATADYIDFHLKAGPHHTLPVTDIREIYFDLAVAILLFFGSGIVRIEGRNLDALHRALRERKVSEVREFSEKAELFFEKDVLFIKRIEYESDNLKMAGLQ